MSNVPLKQRVQARDALISDAEAAALSLRQQALTALRAGDFDMAESAMSRSDVTVQELLENLRIYQAELHAQAEELAESQLRIEEVLNRFSALFSSLPVAAFLVSANGEVLEHNRCARDLFRFHARHLSERFFHRLIDSQQYQSVVRPAFHEAKAMGASVCDAVEFITEGGIRFQGELHIAVLPAGRSSPVQFACVVVDRSEQIAILKSMHDSNRRLAASEAFLADSVHLARLGGWEYTVATDVLRWSEETRLMHAVDAQFQPTVEKGLAFYTPASRPVIEAAFAVALEHGTSFDVELDLIDASQQLLRVRAVGHPEMENGHCARVSGVFQDITEQHHAQQEIGQLTARLGMANEAGGIGIWDWDLQAERVFFDKRMRGLLGQPGAIATHLRTEIARAADAESLARFDAALQDALEGNGHLTVELRMEDGDVLPDSIGRHVHLAGRLERDACQQSLRLIGCAWDCTAEKLALKLRVAKESAEFASQAKSAFLSRMSHELRTPLNAIMGFSQLMRLEVESGDLIIKPHRIAYIETASKHLLDLINEVLDVTRVESGQVSIELADVSLSELLAESLPMVQRRADEAEVSLLDATAGHPDVMVRADRLRLKQVLINLLSNAVKYNRPGGSVSVSIIEDVRHVSVSVHDTGIGMTDAQIAGLFQPFSRVGAETTAVEGSGMGLFVSRRFVELMGGDIHVVSQPRRGSTFTVTLNRA